MQKNDSLFCFYSEASIFFVYCTNQQSKSFIVTFKINIYRFFPITKHKISKESIISKSIPRHMLILIILQKFLAKEKVTIQLSPLVGVIDIVLQFS